MTFGRWILIHSLSISILVMLGVGYFYKEELKLQEAYSQLLLIDATSMTVPKKIASEDIASQNIVASTNKAISNQHKQSATDAVIKDEGSTLKPFSKETSAAFAQKKLKKKTAVLAIDYLLKAREAYWDKNYKEAIQLYKAEINKMPSSADLYGELGNIYYSLEDYDSASSYYLDAGKIFLKMNDQVRAKQIYDILISIAPSKAQLLLNLKNESHQ